MHNDNLHTRFTCLCIPVIHTLFVPNNRVLQMLYFKNRFRFLVFSAILLMGK